jgi:hypothetical protein
MAVMIPRTAAVGQNLIAAVLPPLSMKATVDPKNQVKEYITDSPTVFAVFETIPARNDNIKTPYLYVLP